MDKKFCNALNNAIGNVLEQIKNGNICPDISLYNLIISNNPPPEQTARNIYDEITRTIAFYSISSDELKTIISSIAFPKDIPIAVKLHVVLEELTEINTIRSKQ